MSQKHRRHAWLYALGADDLPSVIEVDGVAHTHLRTYKHDFFAATGLYDGPTGPVVLKLGRAGIGRFFARRERQFCERLAGMDGIPRSRGAFGPRGFVHDFVPGHPLQEKERVSDTFFDELETLVARIHARDVGYGDLHKRENVLVGDDGRPVLIDFQVSCHWPRDGQKKTGFQHLIPRFVGRRVLANVQAADLYHIQKHRRRHRRDQMTEAEIEASYRVSGDIRFIRMLWDPLKRVRRWCLQRLTGSRFSPKQDGPAHLESVDEIRASKRVEPEKS